MTTTPRLEAFNQARHALERARRESERLRAEAIQELLDERKRIDAELRLFGYMHGQLAESRPEPLLNEPNQHIHDVADEPRHRVRRPGGKLHCPYCDIDGHDGRAHRGQWDEKRAFTSAELQARGLAIPAKPLIYTGPSIDTREND